MPTSSPRAFWSTYSTGRRRAVICSALLLICSDRMSSFGMSSNPVVQACLRADHPLGKCCQAASSLAPKRLGLKAWSGRDLTSPIFNIPPKQQVYPDWLEGNWSVRSRFVGFEFPTLPRQQVMREEDVPGFKTCSIIDFADVGKSPLEYNMSFVKRSTDGGVVEDWPSNLCSTVQAHLARGRVTSVDYSPSQDPNRLTMRLVASKNAERVELFVNARDAERPKEDVFLCSEYRRQVTFSSRVQQGYNCNYQHYRTFQRQADGVRLNVLTASYLDPLSPLYFESFDKPVVVFAHELQLSRAEAV
ncbi:unnamed protein product [Durusdinium trenchii]|uniref:DUF6816 domain-containing protein n=1 Tax=Durusdinium trenchii TaxID=1381693 RepID=A0ABP0INW9_9DINO